MQIKQLALDCSIVLKQSNTILKLSRTTPSLSTSKLDFLSQLRQFLIQFKDIHWTSHNLFIPPNIIIFILLINLYTTNIFHLPF